MKKLPKPGFGAFYIVFFSLAIGLFLAMFSSSSSPEEHLIGLWQEVAWEYEKVELDASTGTTIVKSISENIKKEIISNLIIHEAETWEFTKDGKLKLLSENSNAESLEWNLKGRGNILALKHNNLNKEFYNLYKINQEEMVLYFDSDIHAKGIVKMTFRKING
ncbi:hypothetical protein [Paucihalobacter sp.]|uniref:hypothetical protein n=1 Tax=Paucihalobacter sp. TaxID=2850405 RepID=UPI002FE192E1